MGESFLAGLAGGLEGVQQGIARNQLLAQQQIQMEHRILTYLSQVGDPEIQQLAVAGLMEIASKGPQYKGGVLGKVFKVGVPNEQLQKIQELMAQSGGLPAAGTAAPAPGSQAPPEGSQAPPGGPTPPGPPTGAPPAAPAAPQAPQPGGASGVPMTADLSATSPTAATGSSAGPPPQGTILAGIAPQALQEAQKIYGPPPGPPASREEVAGQVAAKFGYTPEELESAEFAYPNRILDPQRQRVQRDFQADLEQAVRTAGTEGRYEESQYWSKVQGHVAEVLRGHRAEQSALRVADRQEAGARRAREKEERTRHAALVKSAKLALNADLARVEKLRTKVPSINSPEYLAYAQDREAYEAQVEEKIQEWRDAAFTRYESITGERAPGRPEPPAPGLLTSHTPRPPRSTPAPPAAPIPTPTPAPSRTPPPGSSGLIAGPPGAPVTPAEDRRAAQIRQKMRRQNLRAADLSEEERSFLADYIQRTGQQGG